MLVGDHEIVDVQVSGQVSMRRIIRDWYTWPIMRTVDEEEHVFSDGFARPCSGCVRPQSLVLIMEYKSCPRQPGGGGEIGIVGYT